MKNLFVINFAENTIVASKTTLKKAGNPNSTEYKEMMKLMKKHPNFTVVEKIIKEATGKETHKGLKKNIIEAYIGIQNNATDLMAQYEAAAKQGKFPLVRKWFLSTFKDFNLEEAKEEIAKARIAEITKITAPVENKDNVEEMPQQKKCG